MWPIDSLSLSSKHKNGQFSMPIQFWIQHSNWYGRWPNNNVYEYSFKYSPFSIYSLSCILLYQQCWHNALILLHDSTCQSTAILTLHESIELMQFNKADNVKKEDECRWKCMRDSNVMGVIKEQVEKSIVLCLSQIDQLFSYPFLCDKHWILTFNLFS